MARLTLYDWLSLMISLCGVSAFWLRVEHFVEQNRQTLHRSRMNHVAEFVACRDVICIDQTLARFEPTAGRLDLRGADWNYHSTLRSQFTSHWNQGSAVEGVALSNDGGVMGSGPRTQCLRCEIKIIVEDARNRNRQVLAHRIFTNDVTSGVWFD